MNELARRLLEAGPADAAWECLAGLSASERGELVEELKRRCDVLVRSDPPAALAAADVLVRAALDDPPQRALSLRARAAALHINGREGAALADYSEAACLYESAGQELEAARVWRSMVDVHQMMGQTREALQCAQAARAVFERLGEQQLLAQLSVNLGNVYARLEDHVPARKHYGEACERFRAQGDALGLAVAEYNLGNLEASANELERAAAAWRAARAVFAQAGQRVHVADCDYSLAWLEARRGRFASAIEGLEAARGAYAESGKPSGPPLCQLDLADIYLRLDARRDALDNARAACAAFGALSLPMEEAKAGALAALARCRLGDREGALLGLMQAQACFERLGNRSAAAWIEVQRATLELETGRVAQALPRLRAARAELDPREQRLLHDLASLALCRALQAADHRVEAEALLHELVLGAQGDSLDRLVQAEAQQALAALLLQRGERAAAHAALESAVRAIEETWAEVADSDVRVAFFRERHAAFAELALLDAEPGDAAQNLAACQVLERSRLRGLEAGSAASADADPELVAAREHLDWLLGRRLDHELGRTGGEHDLAALAPEAGELRAAESRMLQLARASASRRAGLPGRAPLDADVREALAPGELFLSYLVRPRGAVCFVVTRELVDCVPLGATPAALRALRDRLWLQMDKFALGGDYARRQASRLAASTHAILEALGQALLAPLAGRLAGHALVIVPYGALHDLPFHAFRLDGHALVERNDLSYALSTGLLARARRVREPLPRRVLTCGAAEDSLPAVEREVQGVLEHYAAEAERVAPAVLLQLLRTGPPARGLLHLAAHGSFRPDNPLFSGMRLGETFLTTHDIRDLHLACDLVVLSGCETGRALLSGGEELYGPLPAFLAAGARAVLSSSWRVGDEHAAALMQAFYSRLAAGENARRALCAAQRELLTLEEHPFAWAGFGLHGDGLAVCAARGTSAAAV